MKNNESLATKKITRATFKSFVKRNRENLHINVCSSFSGMSDMVEQTNDESFTPVQDAGNQYNCDNNLGIAGVWLVLGSRDSFSYFNADGFEGIHVYNCCGSFTVAIPTGETVEREVEEPTNIIHHDFKAA